ncbi:hypothetical protein B0T17DRAFT_239863 [Bombardia bombarda]|uniref:Uncharacterized protein n=1 Tax=Bombardia bombarda TaxID=252184 RepID=A0AA40CB42_9PEZI|nr:hypothetical protein B0T17DRAFT_239863 [Bombardia bombarda]
MSLPTAPMIDGDVGGDVRSNAVQAPGAATNGVPDVNHTAHTHDPTVSFEEYMYYAEITRKEEADANSTLRRLQGVAAPLTMLTTRSSPASSRTSGSRQAGLCALLDGAMGFCTDGLWPRRRLVHGLWRHVVLLRMDHVARLHGPRL